MKSGPLGWMEWRGAELLNDARAQQYAYTLPGPETRVVADPLTCTCDVLRLDDAGYPVTYVSPAADGAPWYDAAIDESADFYGVIGVSVDPKGIGSPIVREVTERGGGIGGAAFGPQRAASRHLRFTGWLVGATCASVDYGLAWLAHTLATTDCATCSTTTMRLRLTCPPVDDLDFGLVELRECALIYGPVETAESLAIGCCEVRQYEWEIVAGDPWFHGCEVPCLARTVVEDVYPPPTDCITDPDLMTFTDWFCAGPPPLTCMWGAAGAFGVAAPIVTIETGSGAVCDVRIAAFDGATEVLGLTLSGLPAHHTIVLDGVSHRVTDTGPDGVICDGFGYFELDAGRFSWPEICPAPGAPVCLELRVTFGRWCCLHADTAVTISTGARYLAGAAPCIPIICPES